MKRIVLFMAGICSITLHAENKDTVVSLGSELADIARDLKGIQAITKVDDFNDKIKSGNYTVVKFHAPWCPYCVKMDPIFKAIAEKYAESYRFYEVNYDDAPEVCKKNGIRSIPVFRFYDGTGKKVGEISNYRDMASFEKDMNTFFGKKK